MKDVKTDMLTVEQFNDECDKRKSNCLGFAIGVPERIELEYEKISIDESFSKKLTEYGMTVKSVQSLEEMKGKTGFIVYGFYDMVMGLAGMTFVEKKDFHVVRVNPDGSLVHKQDGSTPASHVELLSSKGGISEYNEPNEPIFMFSLEGERNADKDAIRARAKPIIDKIVSVLKNPSISREEREKLQSAVMELKQKAEGPIVTSNDINILIQSISLLSKQYVLGDDETERED